MPHSLGGRFLSFTSRQHSLRVRSHASPNWEGTEECYNTTVVRPFVHVQVGKPQFWLYYCRFRSQNIQVTSGDLVFGFARRHNKPTGVNTLTRVRGYSHRVVCCSTFVKILNIQNKKTHEGSARKTTKDSRATTGKIYGSKYRVLKILSGPIPLHIPYLFSKL
jgi:hypothetical protein